MEKLIPMKQPKNGEIRMDEKPSLSICTSIEIPGSPMLIYTTILSTDNIVELQVPSTVANSLRGHISILQGELDSMIKDKK